MTTPAHHPAPALDVSPVPVHVTGISAGLSLGQPPAAEPEYALVPQTVVLTSDEPVKQLLRPDPTRAYALLISFDYDVVLTGGKGDGQAASNTGDTSYTRPNGGLIPTGIVVPVKNTSELWAASASYPARVTVLACYKR